MPAPATAENFAALVREHQRLLAALSGLPPLPESRKQTEKLAPATLEALFCRLHASLKAGEADSRSCFDHLAAALPEHLPGRDIDMAKLLEEIGWLIDDVEYDTACARLQGLREAWRKSLA